MPENNMDLISEIAAFGAGSPIDHALLLTYGFDGAFIESEECGLLQTLWQRGCPNPLVIRDGKAVVSEKNGHRYTVVNAGLSRRTFHPKMILLVSSSEVLVIIGSANLTRGGLRSNLELAATYRLTHAEGPRTFFQGIHDYLSQHLAREFTGQAQSTLAGLVADLGSFLQDAEGARSQVQPAPEFLHDYERPLWDQIIERLPKRSLSEAWVVSPFYDAGAAVQGDDPDCRTGDAPAFGRLFSDLRFRKDAAPALRVYFDCSSANATGLPLSALAEHHDRVALHAKAPASPDPRRLHAKMLVFVSRDANGKEDLIVVHGSANFTAAALLRTAPSSNAEIMVLQRFKNKSSLAGPLSNQFSLSALFSEVADWRTLSEQPPQPQPTPFAPEVAAALLNVDTLGLTVTYRAEAEGVVRIAIELVGQEGCLHVGHFDAGPAGSWTEVATTVPASAIRPREENPDLGRLPYGGVRVIAFDASGEVIGQGTGPLNVDCTERFFRDTLFPADQFRLDAEILRTGMLIAPASQYEQMQQIVERFRLPNGSSPPTPSHQADLDLFFRGVHLGLRGLRCGLQERNRSLYAFSRALTLLASWAKSAVESDSDLSMEQRLYVCDRVVRIAKEAMLLMSDSGIDAAKADAALRERFLPCLSTVRVFVRQVMQRQPDLGVFVRSLRARMRELSKHTGGTDS